MKRCLAIIFLLHFASLFRAQNLIPDSSFEFNKAIPTDFSAIGYSNTWSRASMGTTDLFSKNDRRKNKYSIVDVPQNVMGFQFPHSGNSYAGFFLFSHGDYREYLQTALTTPLKKNKTYLFSVWINLANLSQTYIDQIGVCFTNEEKHYESGDVITGLDPVYIKLGKAGSDTMRWNKVSVRYKAKGDETHVLFGSFDINRIRKTGFKFPKKIKTIINKNSQRDAYYLVDDVCLIEMKNIPDTPDSLVSIGKDTLSNVQTGTSVVLKNVLFESGRSDILRSSYPDLDKLANYLLTNPELKLKIVGHADNSGNPKTNKKLSEERAKMVALYLTGSGVEKVRIKATGFGDTQALFENDTEEHKAENRRVEIIFEK
ncbi:MAG: OmpA family protein [Bacteroidia bacterium]